MYKGSFEKTIQIYRKDGDKDIKTYNLAGRFNRITATAIQPSLNATRSSNFNQGTLPMVMPSTECQTRSSVDRQPDDSQEAPDAEINKIIQEANSLNQLYNHPKICIDDQRNPSNPRSQKKSIILKAAMQILPENMPAHMRYPLPQHKTLSKQ